MDQRSQNPRGEDLEGGDMEAVKSFLCAIYNLIPIFSGKPEEFDSFVRSVEAAKSLASPSMTHTLFEVVKARIQGPAKELIRSKSFKNWDELYLFLLRSLKPENMQAAPRNNSEKDANSSSVQNFQNVPDSTQEGQKQPQGSVQFQKIKLVPIEKLVHNESRNQVIGNMIRLNPPPTNIRIVANKEPPKGYLGPRTVLNPPRPTFQTVNTSVRPYRSLIRVQEAGVQPGGQIPRSVTISQPVRVCTPSQQITKPAQNVQYVLTKQNQGGTKPVVLSTAGVLVIQIPPKSGPVIKTSSVEEGSPEKFSGEVSTQTEITETESKEIQVDEIAFVENQECQTEKCTVDTESQTDEEITKFEEDVRIISELDSSQKEGKKRTLDKVSETVAVKKIQKKNPEQNSSSVKEKITCSYCSKTGHRLPQCNIRQRDILHNIRQQNTKANFPPPLFPGFQNKPF